jgi:hypothetical protein
VLTFATSFWQRYATRRDGTAQNTEQRRTGRTDVDFANDRGTRLAGNRLHHTDGPNVE